MIDGSKNNNGFTAQDIERYYSGQMSSLEMHQLEKAAMEDPFLADALEGYGYTQTPSQDNDYLQSQLQSKLGGARVVPIRRFTTNQFLRIAALFILLAGCGWVVYKFGFNSHDKDLAVAKTPEITAPSLKTDTNSSAAPLPLSTTEDTNTQTKTVQDNSETITLSAQNRHTGKLNTANTIQKDNTQNNSLSRIEAGSVANEQRDAAELSKPERYLKAKTGNNDTDSGLVADAPQTVSAGKENVIVMQRSKSEPIPEIVLGKSKKDSTYRKPHVSFEEAEPEKGTAYFDDYVAQNLQLPEEEMKKKISGEVKLSFDVNEAGEAINIAVEKSLCTECDKEAIRLLKQGPKLVKKKKDKKGKLSIKFFN
jgi:TonB family protein